jgi:hypothetical protein
MTTMAATTKTPAACRNHSLSLGGSQLSSKCHLSLSERFLPGPTGYRSFVVWATQAVPTVEGGAASQSSSHTVSSFPYQLPKASHEFETQILSWPPPPLPWMDPMLCVSDLNAIVRAQPKFAASEHLLLVLEPDMARQSSPPLVS